MGIKTERQINRDAGRSLTTTGSTDDDDRWLVVRSRDGIVWGRYHVENTGSANNALKVIVRRFLDPDADPDSDTPVAEDEVEEISDGDDAEDHLDELYHCIAVRPDPQLAGDHTDYRVTVVARRL